MGWRPFGQPIDNKGCHGVSYTMTSPPEHPGQRLQTLLDRLRPPMTQADAADRLGVARQTLNALLRGRANLTPAMAVRLERAGFGAADRWLARQLAWGLARAERWARAGRRATKGRTR